VGAELTFVRDGEGERHNVWIARQDGTTVCCRVHVRHDLAHLVVESLLGMDDGLWAALVRDGVGPALTEGHLVAKTLTNAVVNRWGDGADDADGVRRRALEQDPPVARRRRRSFDPASIRRRARIAADRLAAASERTCAWRSPGCALSTDAGPLPSRARRCAWPGRSTVVRSPTRSQGAARNSGQRA
jgi:hypothetical protein